MSFWLMHLINLKNTENRTKMMTEPIAPTSKVSDTAESYSVSLCL